MLRRISAVYPRKIPDGCWGAIPESKSLLNFLKLQVSLLVTELS